MASGEVQKSFKGTCEPIEYRCTVNAVYIDPCSCTSYYLCETRDKIIPRQCSGGTGFNQDTRTCDTTLVDLVLDGKCDEQRPWDRCSNQDAYEDVDEDALELRCTGIEPPSDETDAGLIAGVIIAVLVVIIVIVVLVMYIRKKGNPIQHLRNMTRKGSRGQGTGQPSASRHGSGPGDEETYAEIDDTALYKDPSGGKTLAPTLSHTNETYDRDTVEGVSYDNPALQRDTPPPPPPHPDPDSYPVPPEYSSLDAKEREARSYSSLNEHKAATVSSNRYSDPVTGDDGYLVAEAIGETPRNSSPEDPNYFVLEKS